MKGAIRPMEAAFRRRWHGLAGQHRHDSAAVDTVYAMTVHKSQGSQFKVVAFMLPSADSRISDAWSCSYGGDPGPGTADLVGTEI